MRQTIRTSTIGRMAVCITTLSLVISMITPTKAEEIDHREIPEAQVETKEEISRSIENEEEVFLVNTHESEVVYETSPVITVGDEQAAQEAIIAKVEEEKRLAEEERTRDYIKTVGINPSDVSRITNLRREDMHLLTEGTWWEGAEETLYQLERTYGINAAFAMGVSTLECGSGTSRLARMEHNYYGFMSGKTWNNRHDCTMYFGEKLSANYVGQGRKSVESIGPKYCPPNRQWEVYVRNYMNNKDVLQVKLKNKYGLY